MGLRGARCRGASGRGLPPAVCGARKGAHRGRTARKGRSARTARLQLRGQRLYGRSAGRAGREARGGELPRGHRRRDPLQGAQCGGAAVAHRRGDPLRRQRLLRAVRAPARADDLGRTGHVGQLPPLLHRRRRPQGGPHDRPPHGPQRSFAAALRYGRGRRLRDGRCAGDDVSGHGSRRSAGARAGNARREGLLPPRGGGRRLRRNRGPGYGPPHEELNFPSGGGGRGDRSGVPPPARSDRTDKDTR